MIGIQYVILDLEWNSVYSKKHSKFINEIIEIGAVKLDESLRGIDSYSSLIATEIGKNLQKKVIELTHLTNEDISTGKSFCSVMSDFKKWIGNSDTVVMSWGKCDIYALMENFSYFSGSHQIPFLKSYVDLQEYCGELLNQPANMQLGLQPAAEKLSVVTEQLDMHRGLSDAVISAQCLQKVYLKQKFEKHIMTCDEQFYDRLLFKPYVIKNFKNPAFDTEKLLTDCPKCGQRLKRISKWSFKNSFYRCVMECRNCQRRFTTEVRFKQYYDYVDFKKKVREIRESNTENNKAD